MGDNVLNLVVLRDRVVVESTVLSHKDSCIQKILPPRGPDLRLDRFKVWIAAPEKRKNLVNRIDLVLDKYGTSKDMLYGFFGLMGISSRWLEDRSVEIGLCLGTEEAAAGVPLRG
jgi:hypothetical protein